ncbi:protein o-mannosyl-transferase tmtc2 [Anaeramoeba flamelloides]|uniref:Protein o-mannosyl-transferase tmtc2 n=1 Tax=Anaeramoeba flamelloides TaxID=1746091 RepID=A0ABQ8XSZ9_9EUKA|nr:protein o-mannosyl-transferase tmtc2 [Anaeramoeba flamelloides]
MFLINWFRSNTSKGLDEYKNQNYEMAQEYFLNALKDNENDGKARFYLARMLYLNKKRNDIAKDHLKIILRQDPSDQAANFMLGDIYYSEGELDEASVYYKQITSDNRIYYQAIFNLGLIDQQQGRLDAAAKKFRKVTKKSPDNTNAYYNLGCIYELKGNTQLAKRHYKLALNTEEGANDPDLIYNYAMLLADEGNYNFSYKLLLRGRSLCPEDLDIQKSITFILKRRKKRLKQFELLTRKIELPQKKKKKKKKKKKNDLQQSKKNSKSTQGYYPEKIGLLDLSEFVLENGKEMGIVLNVIKRSHFCWELRIKLPTQINIEQFQSLCKAFQKNKTIHVLTIKGTKLNSECLYLLKSLLSTNNSLFEIHAEWISGMNLDDIDSIQRILQKNRSNFGDLKYDTSRLLLEQACTDQQICGIGVHSDLVKIRCKKNWEEIYCSLENFSKHEIEKFLWWIYADLFANSNTITTIFKKLNIKKPGYCIDDINTLLHDNPGRNFFIESVETNYGVHKFFLYARTNWFRMIYHTGRYKPKGVEDPWKLDQSTLKYLVHFLYTESFPKTKNSLANILLIIDQLESFSESFGLTGNTFIQKLDKLKKIVNYNALVSKNKSKRKNVKRRRK